MLGQFNIARAKWPLDDLRMSGFTNAITQMNAVAERSPGFVWRLIDEHGPQGAKFPGDPRMTFTLSVWHDLESLRHFTWSTIHKRFRMRREEWFEPLEGPYLAIWPIAKGHRPDGAEALTMLNRLAAEGPSADVFGTETLMPATAS